ncbi:hypothetical protein ONZ45_g13563 [Pleurotus djamor]|nr:hypothetical protein ONZ45_g13563 [Pleurotus djamor]
MWVIDDGVRGSLDITTPLSNDLDMLVMARSHVRSSPLAIPRRGGSYMNPSQQDNFMSETGDVMKPRRSISLMSPPWGGKYRVRGKRARTQALIDSDDTRSPSTRPANGPSASEPVSSPQSQPASGESSTAHAHAPPMPSHNAQAGYTPCPHPGANAPTSHSQSTTSTLFHSAHDCSISSCQINQAGGVTTNIFTFKQKYYYHLTRLIPVPVPIPVGTLTSWWPSLLPRASLPFTQLNSWWALFSPNAPSSASPTTETMLLVFPNIPPPSVMTSIGEVAKGYPPFLKAVVFVAATIFVVPLEPRPPPHGLLPQQ